MKNEPKLDRDKLKAELESVRGMDKDGLLRPESAVAWARNNRESVLAGQLEWDDTAAAELHRIEQVRQIVRVVVYYDAPTDRNIRAFLSCPTDRMNGGGYRSIDSALATGRQELVNEAVKGLKRLRARYTHLPELDVLFDAVDRVAAEYSASRVTAKVA